MRFAARDSAVFGQMEVGVGMIPGAGAAQHLTRLVGRGRALQIMLSADDYSADLAASYGWINRALPDAELEGFVTALARRIASFPQAGVLDTTRQVDAISLPSVESVAGDRALFAEGVSRPKRRPDCRP
jgi:enoyl-CoA hydratase/carnithine racemase